MKNGVVVDQRFPGEVVDSDRVKVTLTSPSAPLSQWMMPRPGREWIGYLKIGGATVSTIEAEHFQDDDRNNIAVNPTDPGRVDFIAWTHGSAISFVVTSKVVDTSASEDVTLELHIMAGSTTSGGTPAIRQFSSLDQLRDGAMKRSFEASGHTDLVELTLLNRSPVSSYGFSFRDMTTPRAGDYYYVRVHGAEDQLVWSSPVFAGGFDVTSD